jgi:hypothetical protein
MSGSTTAGGPQPRIHCRTIFSMTISPAPGRPEGLQLRDKRGRKAEAGTAAVRLRSGEDLGAMKLEELIARMRAEVEERA